MLIQFTTLAGDEVWVNPFQVHAVRDLPNPRPCAEIVLSAHTVRVHGHVQAVAQTIAAAAELAHGDQPA